MANDILGGRPLFLQRELVMDRRIVLFYLILPSKELKRMGPEIEVRPDERFYTVISKHVEAYVKDGKAPPKAIATAVLNAADDYLAGRDISLRAGDYIAVQNFARAQK